MDSRKGLILDFGGVLTTPLVAAVAEFEGREGLDQGSVIKSIYLNDEVVRLTNDLERGAATQEEWNEVAGRLLGLESENLLGRIFAGLRPETLMIEAAAAARRAGIRVGVLSNSVGAKPWNLYEGYDLEARFDAVLISEQHGLRKPEREIYELMLSMLDLPGSDCVFVDDTSQYLPPAADLGIATVLAEDPRKTIAQLEALLGVSL